jgi:hypothetical protein
MNVKPTKKSLARFAYFSQCEDELRLPPIKHDPDGYSAAECFHVRETYGKTIPCREPVLLTRAINGKEWHGVNVTNIAEDYVGRITFASDLLTYPDWVRRDILGRAKQIAMQVIGFVPTFVSTGRDFTAMKA